MKINKKQTKAFVIQYSENGDFVDYLQTSIVEIKGKKVKTLYQEMHDCSEVDVSEVIDEFVDLCKEYNAQLHLISEPFGVMHCPCCKREGNPDSVAFVDINFNFIKGLVSSNKTLAKKQLDKSLN